MGNPKEWERQYGQMKLRAERAEARVQELEALLRAKSAPAETKNEQLVQTGHNQWEYK